MADIQSMHPDILDHYKCILKNYRFFASMYRASGKYREAEHMKKKEQEIIFKIRKVYGIIVD